MRMGFQPPSSPAGKDPSRRMAVARTHVRCVSCWNPLVRGSGSQNDRWFHASRIFLVFTLAGKDPSRRMAVARTHVRCVSCWNPHVRGSGSQNGRWFHASRIFHVHPCWQRSQLSNGSGTYSCEVHVMLEPSCEGFWQPERQMVSCQHGAWFDVSTTFSCSPHRNIPHTLLDT